MPDAPEPPSASHVERAPDPAALGLALATALLFVLVVAAYVF